MISQHIKKVVRFVKITIKFFYRESLLQFPFLFFALDICVATRGKDVSTHAGSFLDVPICQPLYMNSVIKWNK